MIAEGNTAAVISLMQRRAGLNRERKRDLQSGTKSVWESGQSVTASMSKTDQNVLTYYMSANDRWGSFWSVVRMRLRRRSAMGTKIYALAVDIQLLDSYAPEWQDLPFESGMLIGVCPEWERIQEALQRFWKGREKEPLPLGVFMLWPRLVEDLQRWATLDAELQTRIGHAVFSLSSIGWTRWFIDEALSICPALEHELGELRGKSPVPDEPPRTSDELPVSLNEELIVENEKNESTLNIEAEWVTIGAELKRIESQWLTVPTRELLSKLVLLGSDASKLLDAIPDCMMPPRILLENRLGALRIHLDELASGTELSWLSEEDLNGIMLRWSLAMDDASSDDLIFELADDVELAMDRLVVAIGEVRSAQESVDRANQTLLALDGEVSYQMSVIRRIELTNRQLQAKGEVIAAERKQTDAMLFTLASASPRGEKFDPMIDYSILLAGRSNDNGVKSESQVVVDHEIGHSIDTVQIDMAIDCDEIEPVKQEIIEPSVLVENFNAIAMIEGIDANAKFSETLATRDTAANQSPVISESLMPAINTAEFSQVGEFEEVICQTDFTASAGDQCRPIWSLLEKGHPSLAYQFTSALQENFPQLHVPPAALLRSTALAPGLIASDGPLALSIGEAFAEIDRAWFEPNDTPSNWHIALNLLLIAATLRPMVLAPAMGAAAIASYRHLNGRYSALLELVRLVGEVSEPLTGFAIGPTVLRSVADEASQTAQLAKLVKDADDWLVDRAPSKKIRYAPASKVWQHWLKPGEAIYKLISPVARGAAEERSIVRATLEELADYNAFIALVRDTDRRQLNRRGQDIEAGALEHLWVATCEAVALAKEWLSAESLLSDAGGRLRALVRQLQLAFDTYAKQACVELSESLDDEWGQVSAASRVLRTEIEAISKMFRQSDAIPLAEIQAKELLARDLLLVPSTSIAQDWVVESNATELLSGLTSWLASPINAAVAFDERVHKGDIAGARLLLRDLPEEDESSSRKQLIDKTRDSWVKDLERNILDARRASEVGLAYGYLSDAERAACEGELSAVELRNRDTDRFDQAMLRVDAVLKKIEEQKDLRIQEAWSVFEREKLSLNDEVAKQVEVPLARSDIHTFNELMQRVRLGMDPWPERDLRRDSFREFFPGVQAELLSQLVRQDAAEVDKLIRLGGSVGQVSFELEGDTQARQDAEEVYRAWASSVGRRSMARDNLRKILDALGLPVRALEQDRTGSGWSLQTTPILDRDICPVPHFGSRAQGRYRIVVLADRLTSEDLLQRIGETSQQIATIVFILSRSPARFWPDLARLSKERQRSFLVLDESILLLLLSQRGSRLGTWFDVALPFTYSEPYDASAGFVPPEMFYGRTSELEAVKAQGGCYFIYGGRQLGKTALLRRAERTFQDPSVEHYAVWIDLLAQGIGERRPAADVWLSVSDKLKELKIPGLDMPSVNPTRQVSIDTFLASIKAFLMETPGRRILLLLDEADHFFEQDARHGGSYAETRRLKQLMDETDRRFKVVFAGLHNVLRTASTSNQPLGHLNEAVRIGPLMDEREIRAAEELITRPIEAAGFEFDDRSLVMRVLAQTNYYPSLIQLYCTQLLRHLRETKLRRRDILGPRFKIYESDIESVFSGRPLRDAIRSKFRLTLQLDDRYEVIAYAIGLEALSLGYDHSQGINWRTIRQDCATLWWPEGFANTTERDFLALLEEMVQLGVLGQAKTPERFSLRNPNVLLLLGSKQEIESTLQAEREPKIEFESTIFRPTLGGRVENPARNPLTYRQLDEVVQMRSSVSLVAASSASGIGNLLSGLRDQPGMTDSRLFVQFGRSTDRKSFEQELEKEIKKRVSDGITMMLVPSSVPWTIEWVEKAQAKVKALKSISSFVSVVFVADPERLWALAANLPEKDEWSEPWLSVLPWARGFVRKWLEELQIPTDTIDRLEVLTGFWGGLLESAAHVKGTVDFVSNLDRVGKLLADTEWRAENRHRLTGGIEEAEAVLTVLQSLGDGVTESDLIDYSDVPGVVVRRALRWAEPLGLIVRQPGGTWALDSFAKKIFGNID